MASEFFAACSLGLEPAVASELRALGATDVGERRGGVAFSGDRRVAYQACLWLRSAVRLSHLLLRDAARSEDELYGVVSSVDWTRFLRLDQTFAIDASVRDAALTHSGYTALKVKDGIVDRFRREAGARPNVDTANPDLLLKVVLHGDTVSIYRELSGESLHKRGWRPIQVKSPLNEATAAGLLILSGWDRASTLVDPMCGSGTFVIAAACMAADRAPGLGRGFAFERWVDFDSTLWAELRSEARARAKPSLPFLIEGADRHSGALDLARKGANAAGVFDLIRFTHADALTFRPASPPASVYVNPPWGERLDEGEDLIESWRDLSRFLHSQCGGGAAFVLSGDPALTKNLGLRATKKWVLMNGPIECRFIRYDVHAKAATEPVSAVADGSRTPTESSDPGVTPYQSPVLPTPTA